MWTPFQKKNASDKSAGVLKKSGLSSVEKASEKTSSLSGMPDTKDMNFLQRMAMKRFMTMNPQEQKKMVEKMLTPKNIAKHKDEILAQLEQARKNGMMSDDQYRMARRKFGI